MSYPETIFVKILLPEKPYLTREKAMLEIPAVEGPYMILPQRAATIKLITSGVLRLFETPDDDPEYFFILGGLAKVRDNSCTILTTRIISRDDVDLEAIKDELQQLNAQEKAETDVLTKHQVDMREEKKAFLSMVAGSLEKNLF